MQVYDILVLVLLVVTTAWGARRGFAKQLATVASLVLGYIVAVNFRVPVSRMIEAPEPWNQFAAMLMLFMGTSLAIWITFQVVNRTIEKTGLEAFDSQMGGLFGLAKGLLLAMVMTMFAVAMLGDAQRGAVLNSFSGYNMCRLLNKTSAIVPSEWQQTIEPYLHAVEQQRQLVTQPPTGLLPDIAASTSDTGLSPDIIPVPEFDNAATWIPDVTEQEPVFQPNSSVDLSNGYSPSNYRQTDSRAGSDRPTR